MHVCVCVRAFGRVTFSGHGFGVAFWIWGLDLTHVFVSDRLFWLGCLAYVFHSEPLGLCLCLCAFGFELRYSRKNAGERSHDTVVVVFNLSQASHTTCL